MTPKIIFEDSDLLVLEKPAGMIVNKSDTTKGEETVQEWVEGYFKVSNVSNGKEVPFDAFLARAGIVHRLDKETSGILLVAKNPQSFQNLQTQFKERKVKKTYTALVHGKVEPQEGEIAVPVGRLPWNRKRFGVLSGGRESVTKYRVLSIKYLVSGKDTEPLTLLELFPKTGRTHQIRVHLQYIRRPIFADPLYAGRKTSRADRKLLSRIFLHASKISFFHPARHRYAQALAGEPKTNQQLSFESKLPNDLEQFIQSFKP